MTTIEALGRDIVITSLHLVSEAKLGLNHLPPIDWLEMCGMQWRKLVPHLLEVAHCQRQLELLVIPLRGNDLPHTYSAELFDVITEVLRCISQIFLGSSMAWVDLLRG